MQQEKFQPRWDHASVDHGEIFATDKIPPCLSHLPTFYHKYFNRDFMEHCIEISERVDDVVTNSEEKTAPPFMERLQKGTVCLGKYPPSFVWAMPK